MGDNRGGARRVRHKDSIHTHTHTPPLLPLAAPLPPTNDLDEEAGHTKDMVPELHGSLTPFIGHPWELMCHIFPAASAAHSCSLSLPLKITATTSAADLHGLGWGDTCYSQAVYRNGFQQVTPTPTTPSPLTNRVERFLHHKP